MRRFIASAIVTLTLPICAVATPITFDFVVNGGPSGPFAGFESTENLTFNDSVLAPDGGGLNKAGLFSELWFPWGGHLL